MSGRSPLMLAALLAALVAAIQAGVAPSTESAAQESPDPVTVPRYGIFERTFTWKSADYSNPWEQVQVTLALTSPSGKAVTVGGFYYAPDTWKARFAPTETGGWFWKGVLTDGMKRQESQGRFTVVTSKEPGFVRPNPSNKLRWVFEDGSPYYPIGIGDCIKDVDNSGSPLDNWGFDGGFRGTGMGNADYGWVTGMDTYLKAYQAAGVNLFRWSVDNCAFSLHQTIDVNGNVYLLQEGRWGDELVRKLRQYGFRVYLVIFGFNPPFSHGAPSPAQMDAVKRYVKYVVDRYGASVDFWELMNEARAGDEWYGEIGRYLRRVDPYQHPISTSWERPDLPVIEINSQHWYEKESELESDRVTWEKIGRWKRSGKPVIVGEQGNTGQNWDARSGVRMRLRGWTAFFAEGVLIFWNAGFAKDYKNASAANIYLGPEERGYLRVLQDFTRGFDPRATVAELKVSDPSRVRGYALRGPAAYAAYLHAYTDHTNATKGIRVTIDPSVDGAATWFSPATGQVLGTQPVAAGSQTLAVPPFTIDVALKIQPASGSR